MNIDLIFKSIICLEFLLIFIIPFFGFKNFIKHWHTSLAGLFVILVSTFINIFCLLHLHQLQDPISWVTALAVGIGFLISADGKND